MSEYLDGKWLEGKRFVFFASGKDVAIGAPIDIVIDLGDNDVTIAQIGLTSDASAMTWQAWAGTQAADDGTLLKFTPRRISSAPTPPIDAMVRLNPTISSDGLPFFDPATEVIAQQGPGSRSFIDEDIISDWVELRGNRKYLIRVINTGAAACKLSMSIDCFLSREE